MGNKFSYLPLWIHKTVQNMALVFLLVIFSTKLYSQISIQYNVPNPIEVVQADLYNLMFINSGSSARKVNLKCILNFSSTIVFQSEINGLDLNVGLNQLSQMTFHESNVLFTNEERFSYFKTNKTLSAGSYRWCIQVNDPQTKEQLTSDCFEVIVEPLTPPLLVYPIDRSEVPILNPTFIWVGPGPQLKGDQFVYDIKICEILGMQSSLDAITRNFGHIMVLNLNELQLPYPFNSPVLENGKSYAWQVTAHNTLGKTFKTEIWTFKIEQDTAFQEHVVFFEAAIIPRKAIDGSFVNIQKEIKIDLSLWNSSEITYQVSNIDGKVIIDNDKQLISKQSGQRFKINFLEVNALTHKSLYSLEIKDDKGNVGFISFKYFKK